MMNKSSRKPEALLFLSMKGRNFAPRPPIFATCDHFLAINAKLSAEQQKNRVSLSVQLFNREAKHNTPNIESHTKRYS